MAPMVSVKLESPESANIIIKIVVFIDSVFEGEPTASDIAVSPDGTTANVLIQYDAPAPPSGMPASYTAHFIEIIYTPPADSGVSFVEVALQDTDPKTSRGTVTTVQQNFD